MLAEYGRMTITEREEPNPGPGESVIRISTTGICGSDLHGYTGDNGRRFPGQVMGHESAGTLVAFGAGNPPAAAVGDAVTFNPVLSCGHCVPCRDRADHLCETRKVIGVNKEIQASFADFVTVPSRNIVPLPPDIPAALGALIEPIAVAYHAARRGGVAPGDDVLIIGGGPVGQSAVLAAQALNAGRIIVSEPTAVRRQLCESLGAHTIDPTTTDVAEAVRAHFGALAHVTLDAVGIDRSLAAALPSTRLGGSIVLVGMGSPNVTVAAYEISTKERSVIGSFTYTDSEFRSITAWTAGRAEQLSRLVARTVSVDDADAAFDELSRPNDIAGKVLVDFSGGNL